MAKISDRSTPDSQDDPKRRRAAAAAERRLREHYELGREALACFPDGETRDPATIARLADRQGVTRDLVWKAADFARRYTPEELEKLCRLRTPARMPLSFSHVRRLLAVKDRRKRARLQTQAAREGWTQEELAAEVIAVQGRRGQGGRAPSQPKTLTAVLRQISGRSRSWLSRYDKAWSEDRIGSLVAVGEDLGDQTDALEQTAELLRKLGRAALELEERLRGIVTQARDAEIPSPKVRGTGRKESKRKKRNR
jgi:hypothetical protein